MSLEHSRAEEGVLASQQLQESKAEEDSAIWACLKAADAGWTKPFPPITLAMGLSAGSGWGWGSWGARGGAGKSRDDLVNLINTQFLPRRLIN